MHGQSSQILQPNSTSANNQMEEQECRGTIYNIFEVRTRAFLKSTSFLLRNSLFSANLIVSHNHSVVYTTADTIPKSSPSHPALSITPCVVHFIALWTLNHFIYIATELYFWLSTPLNAAVSSENCNVHT